jgi:putative colanic acid biosynthesis glycosyltransferase
MAIVTVCLNDLAGLKSTYESLRNQTQPPRQWIVADGDSSDGTQAWLKNIEWPLMTWSSAADGGIYQGMNSGLRQVDADYVLFLNSGDTLAGPGVLRDIFEVLANSPSEPSLLFGDCYVVEENGQQFRRRARAASWVPLGMPTSHQAMVFRTAALVPGFDTRFRLSGDYAAVMKLYAANRGADFMYVPTPLCRFQLGGRSDQHRRNGLQEDRQIRRETLGMGPLTAGILHVAHSAQGWLKRKVPTVHRLMRYR